MNTSRVASEPKEICPPENKPPTVKTTDEMVVYLDTSMSMAGYVLPENQKSLAAKNGRTVFSHTLIGLSSVITLIRPAVKIHYRHVNREVGQTLEDEYALIRAATEQSVYKCEACDQSNLAAAITAFSKPLQTESQGASSVVPGAPENTNPGDNEQPALPRFHILITDGVPSKKGSDEGCTNGSDARCVKNKIFELIQKNWGVTVLGIRSEFNGTVYSEIEPGSSNINKSIPGNLKTYRPFYLYVFSPDRTCVKDLVEKIKTELNKNLVKNGEELRDLPLTDLYADKSQPKSSDGDINWLTAEDAKRAENDSAEFRKVNDDDDDRATFKFLLKIPYRLDEPLNLSVRLPGVSWTESAKAILSPEQLNQPFKWELLNIDKDIVKDSSVRYPEVALSTAQPNEKNELHLRAGWENTAAGKTGWGRYCLVGKLDLEKQKPLWIAEWSTPDDRTSAANSQTLNLETSLGMLWNNPVLEQQPVVRGCFVVGASFPSSLK